MVAGTGAEELADPDRPGARCVGLERGGSLEEHAGDTACGVEDVAGDDMEIWPDAVTPTRELRIGAATAQMDQEVPVPRERAERVLSEG